MFRIHRPSFDYIYHLMSALLCMVALFVISTSVVMAEALNEPIKPVPEAENLDPNKLKLGRKLFFDPILSRDGTVSCASCHDLKAGGADNKKVSIGVGKQPGKINSPTVYNSGLLFRQFWDGRAETLESQIDGPLQNAIEMAISWPDLVAKLYNDANYPAQFKAIYKDGVTRDNIKNAISEFERSLNATNSRFDQYLKGNSAAITATELNGYKLFKKYGCISCHQGAAVGGNMFQVFGVINSYFEQRGNITDADFGRFNITGNPQDKHSFKVPSLRMAALTPPYLHDGNAATLRDAVDIMFKYQLGREAPDEDKKAIIEFILTLVGEHKELKQ